MGIIREANCAYCGNLVKRRAFKNPNRVTCGRECKYKLQENGKIYNCGTCGKEVRKTPGKVVGKVYCSKPCFNVANRPNMERIWKNTVNRIEGICKHCGKSVSKRVSTVYDSMFCDVTCFKEYNSINAKTLSRHPLYNTWKLMRKRCKDPNNHKFANYGARGIKVCPEWDSSFKNFLADMGEKPSPELTLDRIDNDGNYEPSNCRWATAKQQANNQRPKNIKNARKKKLT